MSEKIVQLNEEVIKGQIKELVRDSVEETLNELLEKEAESLTQAARYERSKARQGAVKIYAQIYLRINLDGTFRTDQGRQPGEEQHMRKPTRPLARRIDERQPAPYQQRSPEPVFCNEHKRCQGCPYPRHGIVCWHRDGTCLRTDMEEIGRRQEL